LRAHWLDVAIVVVTIPLFGNVSWRALRPVDADDLDRLGDPRSGRPSPASTLMPRRSWPSVAGWRRSKWGRHTRLGSRLASPTAWSP